MTTNDANWLTRQQAADRIGVSLPTMNRWIRARRVDVVRIGRTVRITPEALADLAHRRRVAADENLPRQRRAS